MCESSIGGKAFLCNSGAEANECAIKLVRKHAHGRGIADPEVVVLEGAFHGRTMGAVSATPAMAANESFAPYLPGFVAVPRDDPGALRDAVGERTAAVMIEPIQGESGVFPVSDEVLVAARESCDASGALLVLDEIQTGMGQDRVPVGLRADARQARRDDHREGARGRPAGGRLRRRAEVRRHARSRATTARPSRVARWWPPRRAPRST